MFLFNYRIANRGIYSYRLIVIARAYCIHPPPCGYTHLRMKAESIFLLYSSIACNYCVLHARRPFRASQQLPCKYFSDIFNLSTKPSNIPYSLLTVHCLLFTAYTHCPSSVPRGLWFSVCNAVIESINNVYFTNRGGRTCTLSDYSYH